MTSLGYYLKPMQTPSRSITTSQQAPHERLHEVVNKHVSSVYKKPIQEHNHKAFKTFLEHIKITRPTELILDSCCGTGFSTLQLARQYPDACIVGIDQSEKRLEKENKTHVSNPEPDNTLFLRANCEDFWRLCVAEGIVFKKHFILYPNPYPKPSHLTRRWHAHPAFSYLKSLSHDIELRTNWKLYAEEFTQAWKILTGQNLPLKAINVENPVTLFERKYVASGQQVWGLSSDELFIP